MLSGEDISDNLELSEQMNPTKNSMSNTATTSRRNDVVENDGNAVNYTEDPKDPSSKNDMCFADFQGGFQDGYAMNPLMFGDGMSSYEAMYFDPSTVYDERNGLIPSTMGALNPLPNPPYDFDTEMLNDDDNSSNNGGGEGSSGNPGYAPNDPMAIDYRGTPNATVMNGPPLSSLMHPASDFYANPYSMSCQQDHPFALSTSSSSSSSSSSSASQLPSGDVTITQQGCSSSSSSSTSSSSISPAITIMVPSTASTSSPLPEIGTRSRGSSNNNGKGGRGVSGLGVRGSPMQQNSTSSGHVVRKYTQRAPRGPESSAMAALDPAVKEFRREKNKRAAREFRDRQKKLLNDLTTRVKDLEAERDGLAIRLQYMENEVKLYKEQINDYRTAMLKFTVSASSTINHNNPNVNGNTNNNNDNNSNLTSK